MIGVNTIVNNIKGTARKRERERERERERCVC